MSRKKEAAGASGQMLECNCTVQNPRFTYSNSSPANNSREFNAARTLADVRPLRPLTQLPSALYAFLTAADSIG